MKARHLLLIIFLLYFPCYICAGAWNEQESNYKKELLTYAKAFTKYAQVVPIIGQDTEATWAAEEVQAMCDTLSAGNISTRESIALLYRMHTVAAYGMTYRSSILSLYTDESEIAAYSFHSVNEFGKKFLEAKETGFQCDSTLCLLGDLSFYYTQIYAKLYNSLENSQVFSTNAFGCSLQFFNITEDLINMGLESSDLLKVQTILDGVSFFQAFVPLMKGFCQTHEACQVQKPYVIEAATFFDRYQQSLQKASAKGIPAVKELLVREFEVYVKKSLEYRIGILEFLTENIKQIESTKVAQNSAE